MTDRTNMKHPETLTEAEIGHQLESPNQLLSQLRLSSVWHYHEVSYFLLCKALNAHILSHGQLSTWIAIQVPVVRRWTFIHRFQFVVLCLKNYLNFHPDLFYVLQVSQSMDQRYILIHPCRILQEYRQLTTSKHYNLVLYIIFLHL